MSSTTPLRQRKAVKKTSVSLVETNVDPLVRLNGNYYDQQAAKIAKDYGVMMKDAKNEPDRVEAQDVFIKCSDTLQHAYFSDVLTAARLHLGKHAVHLKIVGPVPESLFLK